MYLEYGRRVEQDKRNILRFLSDLKDRGLRIAGYGAPAKGNTLLNYCGVGRDFIDYTCDLNAHKQGNFLPGSHIPIRAPEALKEDHPDVVLILPWNLRDEIVDQLAFVREWGGRFAVRTPELTLIP
jgi:C-methyltransferase C-terminal domain